MRRVKRIWVLLLTLFLAIAAFTGCSGNSAVENGMYSEAAETEESGFHIREDGQYTSKDEVALYIHTYGCLPNNYIPEHTPLSWAHENQPVFFSSFPPSVFNITVGMFYNGLLCKKPDRHWNKSDVPFPGIRLHN